MSEAFSAMCIVYAGTECQPTRAFKYSRAAYHNMHHSGWSNYGKNPPPSVSERGEFFRKFKNSYIPKIVNATRVVKF